MSKKQLQHFSDVWGTYPVLSEYCKSIHVNAYDFSKTIDLILRVRNYRLAIDLIYECRDVYNIQPDAMMYETFLEGCIRDGFLREKARAWKRRFHKYPKGIEVRTEHFEFAEFIKEVEEYLGDNIAKATPTKEGVHFKPNRTTKKSSRQFYKYYPNIRYTSIFEKMDKYDWVPEYVKRVCRISQYQSDLTWLYFRKKKLLLSRFNKKRLRISMILNVLPKSNKKSCKSCMKNLKDVYIFHRKRIKLKRNKLCCGKLKNKSMSVF